MSDAFYIPFDSSLTGTAGEFGGRVGGLDIGPQQQFDIAQTTPVAPAQSFAPTETGYTPTFDFSAFMPAAPMYTTFGAGGQAQQVQDPYANVQAAAAPMPISQFAGPVSQPSLTPQLQALYGQAAQPLPSVIGQFAGPQGADLQAGLYDTGAPAQQQDKAGFLQSLLGKGFSLNDALKLALGIGGGIMGMQAQKKAADEAAAAEAEYKAAAQKAAGQYTGLAQPYLTAGGSQLAMALQGSLAPAQMQQLQAAQAQLAQGAERTGGVGSIQSAAALQNLYQQALQNQQNMALQLLGPGNTLASNAIYTELQGTQGGLKLGLDLATQANQASQNMYSAIASMIGGQRPSTQTATS